MKKGSIIYKGNIIEYNWTKSNRKTMVIEFNKKGEVVVKTPNGTTKEEVEQFITKYGDKVLKYLADIKKEMEQTNARTFQGGDTLYYLGEEYRLHFNTNRPAVKENTVSIALNQETKTLEMFFRREAWAPAEIKEVLERWYRERAKKIFSERTRYFADKMGCTYGTIAIKNQKTRYGSCSSKGNLNYNWRIIMAPSEVVDDIVVHELCHRFEMNHSSRFWALVKRYLPDYETQEKWLKENRHKLVW